MDANDDRLQNCDLQTKSTKINDALEFPNGEVILLTNLAEGQQATVLQLPASPEKLKEQPAPEAGRAALLDRADVTN